MTRTDTKISAKQVGKHYKEVCPGHKEDGLTHHSHTVRTVFNFAGVTSTLMGKEKRPKAILEDTWGTRRLKSLYVVYCSIKTTSKAVHEMEGRHWRRGNNKRHHDKQ